MTKKDVATQQAPAMNPLTLLDKALAADVDVDKMRELMALEREWKADRAREAFIEDRSNFKQQCPAIEKKAPVHDRNGNLMYTFAPLEALQEVVDPILPAHNLDYHFDQERDENGTDYAVCVVTHSSGHEVRVRHPIDIMKIPNADTAKNRAGGTSMAQRMAFRAAFSLRIVGEDTDNPPEPVKTITEAEASALKKSMEGYPSVRHKFCELYEIEVELDLPADKLKEARGRIANAKKAADAKAKADAKKEEGGE